MTKIPARGYAERLRGTRFWLVRTMRNRKAHIMGTTDPFADPICGVSTPGDWCEAPDDEWIDQYHICPECDTLATTEINPK